MFDNIRRSSVPVDSADSNVEAGVSSEIPSSSSLDWSTKVQCFIGCFVLSCVASLCASWLLFLGRISGFCILTSIGSLLSLVGTCFLMGPVKQCQNMFNKNRWMASLGYILCIIMALISGLVLENMPLAVIFTVLQYVAMAWYSLSYIPGAREFITRMLCNCF